MTDLYGGIVDRARSMYPYREDAKKGQVVSTLVYGTAWDEIIRFLKTNEKYKNIDKDSSGFGNVGVNCDANGWDSTNRAILTGSNEAYCLNNIYDFVGNVWEWTMETYKGQTVDNNLGRLHRGGSYYNSGYYFPVSLRANTISTTYHATRVGGRVQLYIK